MRRSVRAWICTGPFAVVAQAGCRTAAIEVLSLGPDDTVLRRGDTLTLTVTLTDVPDAPIEVRLFGSNTDVAEIVATSADCVDEGAVRTCTVTVPANSLTTTFDILGLDLGEAEFSASVGPTSRSASTQVLEAPFLYDSGVTGTDATCPGGGDSGC